MATVRCVTVHPQTNRRLCGTAEEGAFGASQPSDHRFATKGTPQLGLMITMRYLHDLRTVVRLLTQGTAQADICASRVSIEGSPEIGFPSFRRTCHCGIRGGNSRLSPSYRPLRTLHPDSFPLVPLDIGLYRTICFNSTVSVSCSFLVSWFTGATRSGAGCIREAP